MYKSPFHTHTNGIQQRLSVPQIKSSVVNNIRNVLQIQEKTRQTEKGKVGHQQSKVDANSAQQSLTRKTPYVVEISSAMIIEILPVLLAVIINLTVKELANVDCVMSFYSSCFSIIIIIIIIIFKYSA
jgi:hypothetical protein